ncbi:LysR substrate-binding domain-containing protein [Lysobacter niastensis]|uniref:LysR family transcriptional regulator n=1 Tax=Lysobacter niastensis TaxID=380629 RepID=A0ABS0BCE5_9GAMM|nr:LysR substrate-binding domain-containing protein [Lysobacter niastensis]MBF6025446.1 LysR family transcriptional regulator [Lysobacter niastensis]
MNAMTQVPVDRLSSLPSSFSASYSGVMAFIAVAHEGSFARASDRLGVGRSAVSRSIQKLESQLGTRLFSRTTRSTTLTTEGERFFENCLPGVDRILQALEEMRDLRDGPPRGQLRISSPHGFGRKVLAPLMNEFRKLYPEIAIELMLDERVVDLTADRVDVAFRDGRLSDCQVIAKQLIPRQMLVCASPAYARRYGLPATIEDLKSHTCINRRLPNGRLLCWDFKVNGLAHPVTPQGDIVLNDDDLMMSAVRNGRGLAQLPEFQVSEALRKGELVTCLCEFAADDQGHYLCYLSRRQLPKRIRVFIDYITTRVRALNLACVTEMARFHTSRAHDADAPNASDGITG